MGLFLLQFFNGRSQCRRTQGSAEAQEQYGRRGRSDGARVVELQRFHQRPVEGSECALHFQQRAPGDYLNIIFLLNIKTLNAIKVITKFK